MTFWWWPMGMSRWARIFWAGAAAALRDPKVGLVSCPYRAGRTRPLGSSWRPSPSRGLYPVGGRGPRCRGHPLRPGRHHDPQAGGPEPIGGLALLADYLADDYQLGFALAQTGLQVKILPYVVETLNPRDEFSDYLAHQLRWTRTYRVCRPAGYLAYGITHALVYSLAILLVAGLAPWAWGLVAATLVLRGVLAGFAERRSLKGGLPLWAFGLLPLKDLLAFGLWLASFLGSRVAWGGRSCPGDPRGQTVAPVMASCHAS